MQFKATGLLILLVLGSLHDADAWGWLKAAAAGALHGLGNHISGDQKLIQDLRSLASQDAKLYDEVMHHLGNYIEADVGAAKAQLIMPMLDALATMRDDELDNFMQHYSNDQY